MMSPSLVNVSLAWYLLLLNFDLKDELADDLSASPSTVTGDYGRGELLAQFLLMSLFVLGNDGTEWEGAHAGFDVGSEGSFGGGDNLFQGGIFSSHPPHSVLFLYVLPSVIPRQALWQESLTFKN